MIEFFKSVLAGAYDFHGLVDFLGKLIEDAKLNANVAGVLDAITAPISGFIPIIMIVLGVISLLFGQKFISIAKFFAFGLVGYAVGVVAVTPLINQVFPLSETICGVVVAIVCAVCCKTLYIFAMAIFSGMFAYVVCFSNGLIPFALPTEGNQTLSLIIASIVILTVLVCRRNVERIGLAALGGYLISQTVAVHYVPIMTKTVRNIIFGILWFLGYLFQYKKRKRY